MTVNVITRISIGLLRELAMAAKSIDEMRCQNLAL